MIDSDWESAVSQLIDLRLGPQPGLGHWLGIEKKIRVKLDIGMELRDVGALEHWGLSVYREVL